MRAVIVWLAWILAGFREEFRRAGRMVPGGREPCAKTPFAKSRKGARNIHLIFIGSPPWRVPSHMLCAASDHCPIHVQNKAFNRARRMFVRESGRELRRLRFADAARTQRYS